ncbi:MAG: GreA/GreB family elongation factor [Sphingobacteriaceae bacterium]
MESIQINLSKGIYDLLKNHLRVNNKLPVFNKTKLENELKFARLSPAKSLPADVVTVNTHVQIKDLETEQELAFGLVAPGEAKISLHKLSVLSPIGVALLGYAIGHEVQWEMPEGLKTYRIEKVSPLQ